MNWINGVNGCYGQIIESNAGKASVGAEALNATHAPEKHYPFIEYAKSCDDLGTGKCFAGDHIEIGTIYCVIASVKPNRGDTNIDIEKICGFWTDAQCVFYV